MIIFYTASYFGKEKYQKYYDLVLNTLEEFNVTLVSTEKGNYKELLGERVRTKLKDNPKLLHYEAIKQGIRQADAVILEVSNEDFQVGHEATVAINEKKPTLTLSVNEGEIFGIVGPDGAGKSSIMRLLTAIMDPTSGDAWVYGRHIVKEAEAVKENSRNHRSFKNDFCRESISC